MAKQFLANRSGQTPTLDEVPNETIKIYPTEAALDADLANLEEDEIVATDEDNNHASGTQYPVDIVQDGNMHAVTSNAVAGYASSKTVDVTYSGTDTTHYFATARWHIFEINGLCILSGYNTTSKSVTPTWQNLPKPSGYTTLRILFADAYIDGNSSNVNGSLANDILYVTASGTIPYGGFRMMYIATKN